MARRKNTSGRGPGDSPALLYGKHAVLAALANPARRNRLLMLSAEAGENLRSEIKAALERAGWGDIDTTTMARRQMEDRLPPGAVHQGIAMEADPLPAITIESVIEQTENDAGATAVILDQASDPHNIGAVVRSAAAFGAAAVIVQDRHAPEITAVMAKAASGALERVAVVRATNLVRTMTKLKAAGFWCIGLDGRAKQAIGEADLSGRVALVLGAEGSGLRRLTRENCDLLVRVPITAAAASLNLSNAAAIALYEKARQKGGPPLPD